MTNVAAIQHPWVSTLDHCGRRWAALDASATALAVVNNAETGAAMQNALEGCEVWICDSELCPPAEAGPPPDGLSVVFATSEDELSNDPMALASGWVEQECAVRIVVGIDPDYALEEVAAKLAQAPYLDLDTECLAEQAGEPQEPLSAPLDEYPAVICEDMENPKHVATQLQRNIAEQVAAVRKGVLARHELVAIYGQIEDEQETWIHLQAAAQMAEIEQERPWDRKQVTCSQLIEQIRSSPEALKRKTSAQRQARKAMKQKHGLAYLPRTRGSYDGLPEVNTAIPGFEPHRVAFTGSQGIGKTRSLVGEGGALHATLGMNTVMLLPDGEKAAEAAQDYAQAMGADSPPFVLVQGRTAQITSVTAASIEKGADTLCLIPEAAKSIMGRGESVASSLCLECPFFEECEYQRRAAEIRHRSLAESGVVIFGTHDYLSLPIPGGASPDLVIVDERPNRLIEAVEIDPSIVANEELDAFEFPLDEYAKLGGAEPKNPVSSVYQGVLNALETGHVLGYLVSACGGRETATKHVEEALSAVAKTDDRAVQDASASIKEQGPNLQPHEAEGLVKAAITETSPPIARKLATLFKTVRDGLALGNEWINGVYYKDGKLHACRYRNVVHSAPMMILDGTASMTEIRAVFGATLERRYRTRRLAEVIQVSGRTFSNTSLISDARSSVLRGQVRSLHKRYPNALTVATKKVLPALGLEPDTDRVANFGALRGRNGFRHCASAIIIGRAMPSLEDLENLSRPLADKLGHKIQPLPREQYTKPAQNGQPPQLATRLTLPKQTVLVSDARGIPYYLPRPFHPDPVANEVLRQQVEAEIEQAVDRLRLIFPPDQFGDVPRKVFLLNAHPCVAPDRVMTWEALLEAEISHNGKDLLDRVMDEFGFVPLGRSELKKLAAGKFGASAARALSDHLLNGQKQCGSQNGSSPINNILIESSPISGQKRSTKAWHLVTYRKEPSPAAQRPQLQRAFVKTAEWLETRNNIEAQVGALAEFDHPESPDAQRAAKQFQAEVERADALDLLERNGTMAWLEDVHEEYGFLPISDRAIAELSRLSRRQARKNLDALLKLNELDPYHPTLPCAVFSYQLTGAQRGSARTRSAYVWTTDCSIAQFHISRRMGRIGVCRLELLRPDAEATFAAVGSAFLEVHLRTFKRLSRAKERLIKLIESAIAPSICCDATSGKAA